METRAHYVVVGAFVFATIILGFCALVWLGRVQISENFERYYIFFKGPVAGLSRGSAVQYNGIPVGRVVDVRVDPDNIEQVQVTVEIDRNLVHLRLGSHATLDTNILSGVSMIQIRGGTQEAPDLGPRAGHKYAEIPAGESSLQRVSATVPELLDRFNLVADHLDALLDEKNRKTFSASLSNLQILTGALASRSEELRGLVANADGAARALKTLVAEVDRSYAGRDGIKDRLLRTLDDYDGLAKSLTGDSRQLDAMLRENRPGLREFTRDTLPKADAVLAGARELVTRLDRVAAKIEDNPSLLLFGEGQRGYRPQ